MTPLVSILIPAFNAEEWIAATLTSAVSQTWPRKEIVVVDDGSRDRTLSIARRFAGRQVAVLTQANQGAAATRNQALSLAQGDYIQWLDADDLLAPDKIARQVDAVQRGAGARTLLSSAWGRFMYRPRAAHFTPSSLWCDLSPREWLLRKMADNVYMQTATWLVSRELTDAAGPWNTQMLGDDDGEYFCRVLLASDGTRFVPEARVFYRVAGSSRLSHIGRSERKMEAQFASMRLHVDRLLSLDDGQRARAVCVAFLQRWLPSFYPERLDIVEQSQQLAARLGGRLDVPPPLSWKYSWMDMLCGRRVAKTAQIALQGFTRSLARSIDKARAHVDPAHLAGRWGT